MALQHLLAYLFVEAIKPACEAEALIDYLVPDSLKASVQGIKDLEYLDLRDNGTRKTQTEDFSVLNVEAAHAYDIAGKDDTSVTLRYGGDHGEEGVLITTRGFPDAV